MLMLGYILLIILSFVIGYKISSRINRYYFCEILLLLGITSNEILKLNGKLSAQLGIDLTKYETPEKVINIKIERNGSNFYCYEELTDKFICQGSTIEKLIKNMTDLQKSNNLVYNISVENGGNYFAEALEFDDDNVATLE